MNHKKVLGITFAAVLMTATSANAQFGKSSSLADQVTQLREDVLVLQRESYRDKNSATGNTNFAVQVGEFDENLRQAIGKIDELEYKIKSLMRRMMEKVGELCIPKVYWLMFCCWLF